MTDLEQIKSFVDRVKAGAEGYSPREDCQCPDCDAVRLARALEIQAAALADIADVDADLAEGRIARLALSSAAEALRAGKGEK